MKKMAKDSILARIARKEVPANIIYEDDEHMVILDRSPLVEGHALIIPKYHAVKWNDLSEEQAGEFGKIIRKITGAMEEYFKCDYAFHNTSGKGASQAVEYLHVHVYPRKKEDRLWDNEKSRLVFDTNNEYNFERLEHNEEKTKELCKGLTKILRG